MTDSKFYTANEILALIARYQIAFRACHPTSAVPRVSMTITRNVRIMLAKSRQVQSPEQFAETVARLEEQAGNPGREN